jgi:hypothetical protein
VQSVVSIVLLSDKRLQADLVLAIADAVDVSPRYGVVYGVRWVNSYKRIMLGHGRLSGHKETLTVILDIIVSEHNIDIFSILVLDEKIGQGGAVRNELQEV